MTPPRDDAPDYTHPDDDAEDFASLCAAYFPDDDEPPF